MASEPEASKPTDAPHEEAFTRLRALGRGLASRKVVQWGIAYLALAFGVLQGVALIADTLSWPPSVTRIALALLTAGFPIALIIAWHHGDRGRQTITRAEMGMIGVCAAAGLVLAVFAAAPNSAQHADNSAGALPRLAVLRLETLGDTEPYFAEGVADELISEASRIQGLEVSARASSFALSGAQATPAAAAHTLGATLVLTGSVRRLPDRVRVQAQLVEAPNGRQIWDQTFERPTGDIYALQRDIAVQVARAAGLRVQASETRHVSPEALQLYLRGRELQLQRMHGRLPEARDLFRQAVTLDPDFAEAWAWLGYTELQLIPTPEGDAPTAATFAPAFQAAQRARALKPDLSVAHEILSAVAAEQGQWAAAREAGLQAEAHGDFAFNWRIGVGSFAALVTTMRRQVTLNPQNENLWAYLGEACLDAGDYLCTIDAEHRALELNPNHPAAIYYLFEALRLHGVRDEARRVLSSHPEAWRAVGLTTAQYRRALLVQLGDAQPLPAVDVLAAYRRGDTSVSDAIEVLTTTGHVDEAARLLPEWGGDFQMEILYQPELAPIRARPEFWALMIRKGLVAYWRSTGEWPDFCAREHVCPGGHT